jgi:hypothetical protein
LTRLCFKSFFPRDNFDYSGFVKSNFRDATSFSHVPHLEDYWANCPDEFEVRKRLWSRMIVKQINMFQVDLVTQGVTEEDTEEIVDPFYVEQIEYLPIHGINWE